MGRKIQFSSTWVTSEDASASGKIDTGSSATNFYVNETDSDSTSRESVLDLVLPGSSRIVATNSGGTRTMAVTSVVDIGTYRNFGITVLSDTGFDDANDLTTTVAFTVESNADVVYKRSPSESFGPELWTWRDLLTVTADWAGARASALNNRLIRTAVLNAYRDLGNYHPWRFLTSIYQLSVDAAASLVGYYDHSGNSGGERCFVVTSGSVPTWAEFGSLLLDNVVYEVDRKVDSTHLTLTLRTNPGQDVGSSGSTYSATLYRSTYPAPPDFVKAADPLGERGVYPTSYLNQDDFIATERRSPTSGKVQHWTATAHPKLYGSQAIRVYPYPTAKETLQIFYRRQLRRLAISGFESADFAGTATGAGGTTSLTVASGSPSDRWIGSVIRLRASGTETPGNLDDHFPYHAQATIVDRLGNILTLDQALPQDYSGVGYVVSDPLDVPQYGLNVLQAMCKASLATHASKDAREVLLYKNLSMEAITIAMQADNVYEPKCGAAYPHFQDDDPSWTYPG